MLEALQRVRGAISTKDMVPVLTHFVFNQGTVAGFDGRLYIQAPLPKRHRGLACTVKADRFLSAFDACQGEPVLTQVPGKLRVSRGSFVAELATGNIDQAVPPQPDPPSKLKVPGIFMTKLRGIRPFIGEDASREWACGLLLDGGYGYATNNVILAAQSMRSNPSAPLYIPGKEPVSVPAFAIDELIRIGDTPSAIGRSKNSITFHYENGSWLRSTVFSTAWPKPPDSMLLNVATGVLDFDVVTPDLVEAVRQVIPLCPDQKNPILELKGREVKTQDGEFSARVNGLATPNLQGFYRADALLMVLEVAERVSWKTFPRVVWHGHGMKGLLVGVHA